MKYLITVLAISACAQSFCATKGVQVVYGVDNRKDTYEVTNPLHLKLAKSTAAMVSMRYLRTNGNGDYTSRLNVSLERGLNVCPSERFSQQPLLSQCSGFLVGNDTLVTAGHCYMGDVAKKCREFSWVFDYKMESEGVIHLDNFPKDNVYRCKRVIHQVFNGNEDFAVIQLDREVVNREPLEYRKEGKVNEGSNLVVIGHPSMLPQKISDGGRVLRNYNPYQFTTSLDTFQGNSGSAVFDANSGVLEGILVSGKKDYILSDPTDKESCKIVNYCDMGGTNCDDTSPQGMMVPGENVTRITTVTQYIPAELPL